MAAVVFLNEAYDTEKWVRNLCSYIIDSDRTYGYYDARGTQPDRAAEEMLAVQQSWGKDFGRRLYHIVVSFSDMEGFIGLEALDIAFKISSLFFPEYQVLYGVHMTQQNLHIHFAVNTTSMRTGKKLNLNYGAQAKLRDQIDEIIAAKLAEEYGGKYGP